MSGKQPAPEMSTPVYLFAAKAESTSFGHHHELKDQLGCARHGDRHVSWQLCESITAGSDRHVLLAIGIQAACGVDGSWGCADGLVDL